MNLPNKLTISRMALAFVFIIFLCVPGLGAKIAALLTFALASATDLLDGYIAKKTNQITDFGRLMDPIADKVLILSAFIAFVQMQLVPAWMVIVIIFREAAVTGLRALALAKGKVMEAGLGGKHKTAAQVIAIFFILLVIVLREAAPWSAVTENVFKNVIFALMLITVTMTLASGISYLARNREIYSGGK